MKRTLNLLLFVLAFFAVTIPSYAQSLDKAMQYVPFIDQRELYKHLSIFASDEFEGRETGKNGQKMAAEYLKKEFSNLNLSNVSDEGYYQTYKLYEKILGKRSLIVNQKEFEIAKTYYPTKFGESLNLQSNEIYFVGYGINDEKYNSFKGLDIENKVVIIVPGEPEKDGKYLISKDGKKSSWSNLNKKIAEIEKLKPSLILCVDLNFDKYTKYYTHKLESSSLKLAYKEDEPGKYKTTVLTCNESLVNELLLPNKKNIQTLISKLKSSSKAPSSIKLKSTINANIEYIVNDISAENVLAMVEGSDKTDEYIFITAHYDHIGVIDGEVYNGADDDGSGTVALLEIAQAFSQAKKDGFGPRRNVVFMAVSGEEKGLLGSEYYTDHPIVPLSSTIANLNIDMIGRVDDKHIGDSNYVYIIGSDKLSSELHKINENANEYIDLKLDYTYNDPKDPNMFYYRSDHYNFAKNNIPIIFYFNGVHEDYHKAGDEVSKINFPMLTKRAQLVFLTAWELANREQRIVVDKTNDFPTEK